MKNIISCPLPGLFVLSGVFACLLSAQSLEPINREPVELPKYEVVATKLNVRIERWLYTAWNDFEVISNVDEATTTRIIQNLQAKLTAIESITPALRTRSMLPYQVIIHGDSLTRIQLQAGMSGGERGDRNAGFVRLKRDGRTIGLITGTVYARSYSSTSPQPTISTMPPPMAQRASSTVFRPEGSGTTCADDYIRNRLDQLYPPMPRWCWLTVYEIVGLTRIGRAGFGPTSVRGNDNEVFLGFFDYNRKFWRDTQDNSARIRAHVATITTNPDNADSPHPRTDQGDASHIQMRRPSSKPIPAWKRVRAMPMDLMFDAELGDPRLKKYSKGFWTLQCYTFWHYCCVRSDAGKLKQGYMTLVEKSAAGPITEEVFRESMGMSFEQMRDELRAYVSDKRAAKGYDYVKFTYKSELKPPDVPLRKASEAEVARIKGEALSFQGKYELARQIMLAAYDRKKADPALCASLGVLEFKAGELEKARALLTVAIETKVRNPEAHRTMARMKLDAVSAGEKKGQARPRLSAGQAAPIYELLLAARALPPASVGTYLLLGELMSRTEEAPTEEQLNMLAEGRRRFGDDKELASLAGRFLQK